jgi:hypothetical protein
MAAEAVKEGDVTQRVGVEVVVPFLEPMCEFERIRSRRCDSTA